ncbi:hypothetical protein HAX54_018408 [Datura stramonium]|uniref:Uncharacterized protein n=1 Tax=Datura stramonium TaxID=4076 RepID=A0ABS8S3L4_DATST|nr:hypothetical protein [Datura stramonium]
MPCAIMTNSPIFSNITRTPKVLSPFSANHHLYNRRNIREEEGPAVCSTSSPPSASAAILKRKRPARISIPIVSLGLGHVGETPREESRLDEVEVEGEGYSVFL